MADSNSTSPRCPCGFWGTPQCGGLCSKCYKDKEQKSGASSLPTMTSLAVVQPEVTPPVAPIVEATPGDESSNDSTIDTEASTSNDNGAPAKSGSQENGAKKRDVSEVEVPEEAMEEEDRPVQKNKKRCFKCNVRLELAIREIGRCQCNYVFCQLHRLPEQHDCVYDHKEKGRKQARDQMVSPKKHAGTSIKRMDSHS